MLSGDTLNRIAKACDVRPQWLIDGTGEPGWKTVERGGKVVPLWVIEGGKKWHPARVAAAEFGRACGISEDAIGALLDLKHDSENEPSPEYWFDWLKKKDAQLRSP